MINLNVELIIIMSKISIIFLSPEFNNLLTWSGKFRQDYSFIFFYRYIFQLTVLIYSYFQMTVSVHSYFQRTELVYNYFQITKLSYRSRWCSSLARLQQWPCYLQGSGFESHLRPVEFSPVTRFLHSTSVPCAPIIQPEAIRDCM